MPAEPNRNKDQSQKPTSKDGNEQALPSALERQLMNAKETKMLGNLRSKIARNGPSKAEQDQGACFQGTGEEVVDKIFALLKTNKPLLINNASEYLYKRTALITQSQDSGRESEVPDTDAAQQ
jgi:hypothetical protein